MFDLSKILRIKVLGIPDQSFHGSPLNSNNKQREISETNNKVSGDWFCSSSIGSFMPLVLFIWGEENVLLVRCIGEHSLFYIGWPLEFLIIPLIGHPDIHSLSPYQLIKYLINYLIRNLIALLLNLITSQLRVTIGK